MRNQFEENTSEKKHQEEINHFIEKFNPEVFKKSPEERAELKRRMYVHPGKNHAPNNQ